MAEAPGPSSTIARAQGWVVEALGGEVVMLDPERDRYLRLNRTGSFLWGALEQPATVSELAGVLARAEGIPMERARDDTVAFLTQLIAHGAARSASRGGRAAR